MQNVMQDLASGRLTAATLTGWCVVSVVLSVAAGALAGVALGGKELGNSLAALMGAMYGPLAAVPAVLVGLIVLAFI